MDNQHRKIAGYRELNDIEIALVNAIKGRGSELEALIGLLRSRPEYDQRWISIGATHLQQGLMALTRAVARPESF